MKAVIPASGYRFFTLAALLVAITFIQPCFSQHQKVHFTHLSVHDGLSQSDVQAIVRDKYGFMWFATQDGLNRYDGYKFSLYKNDPNDPSSLRSNIVNTIYEDRLGNFWVGTTDGGLSLYDRNRDSFIHFRQDLTDTASLSNNSVTCIYEDKRGNLWVGTYLNLNIFDRSTRKFRRFAHNPSQPTSISHDVVLSLAEDTRGNLWVGTENGLNQFNYETQTFRRFLPDAKKANSIQGKVVRAMLEDNKNNLWIGTDQSLELFNYDTESFTHFQENVNGTLTPNSIIDNVIFALADHGDGNIWIGTENGLDRFNTSTKRFTHFRNNPTDLNSISNNSINTILHDPTGILWVGTFAGGINKYDINLPRFEHYSKNINKKNSLSHNIVTSFAENENGEFWIGTDGGGLNLFNKENDAFTTYKADGSLNAISSNTILELLIDRDKNLWIGTYDGGLDLLNTKTGTFRHYKKGTGKSDLSNNSVFALLESRDGKIYIGLNEGGLNVLDKSTQTITRYVNDPSDFVNTLINNDIRIMMEDKDGKIWIGTYAGLSCFDPVGKTFRNFLPADSTLTGATVFSLYQDNNDNIWAGTMGALNLYNKVSKKFIPFPEQSALANTTIKYITGDQQGNLWLSTNKGISQLRLNTGTFYNYEMEHGLQAYEFFHGAGLRTTNGQILLGGINGFNMFDPLVMTSNKVVPPVMITGFQLFNKSVGINEENSPLEKHITETKVITLSHDQSVFTIEYTALGYTIPERNTYAFILEGFEADWNYVGTQRKTTYTNLDPGEYVFRVRASNNDGLWNEQEAVLKIIILPPYWRTWWFRCIVVGIVLGSVFAFFKIRINRINATKARLESLVAERTEKLALMTKEERNARKEAEQANRAKSVFLATMSHEIRTPMNGVIGTASLLAETNLNHEQRRYAEIIRSSGESLLSVINDILDFSKIESGKMELEEYPFDLRLCIEEVLDLFAGKAADLGIDLIYELGHDVPEQVSGDSTRLRQILINLIGNALKFTEKGEVFIGVRLEKRNDPEVVLTFEIRDTGIGIPNDKIDRLFAAFMQVDSATSRKYGGTGLGLAICKRLVELMRGNINVESRLGQGTVFRFTIVTTPAATVARPYVHCDVKDLEGKRILVIDDNETNRYILTNQLLHWNFVPTTAESGKQALQLLEEGNEFDLVITDMKMPEMNGVELAMAVKEKYPKVPLFLLSSIGDERRREFSDLFSTILTKPVKQQHLCKSIVAQFRESARGDSEERDVPTQKLTTDFALQYPMKILVAEDNAVNQLLAMMVLKKLGYEPHTVTNGIRALEAASREQYDLILMDVQMPEMDGMEATQLIRQQLKLQPVIIAATANAMQEDRESCIAAGMDDYISKPLELEALVKMIEKWAQHRQESAKTLYK